MAKRFRKLRLFPRVDAAPGMGDAALPGRGAIIAGSLVINILGLAFPLFMLQVYDRILPFRSTDTLFVMAVGVFIALCFEAYLRYCRAEISNQLSAKFEHGATLKLMARNLARPLNETEWAGPGRLMESFRSISNLKSYYAGQNFQQILDLPFVLIYIAVAAAISPVIGASIIFGYVCFAVASLVFLRSFSRLSHDHKELEARRTNFLTETFKNAHTLKSLAMEATIMRRYERLARASAEYHAQMTRLIEGTSIIGTTFSALLSATAITLGAYLSIEGQITNGELAAIILLTLRCAAPVQRFGSLFVRQLQDTALSDRLAEEIMEQAQPHPGMPGQGEGQSDPAAPAALPRVVFRDVTATFKSTDREILSACNFVFNAGEFVVLTGPSGSGRSTVLELIAGFIEPTKGEVRFECQAGSAWTDLKSPPRLGYLSATSEFFDGTLLDNVSLFESVDVDAVRDLSRRMGADEIISRLPYGLNTGVGDKVVEILPAGWSKHIMAVRAFASGLDIVLIDNATVDFDVAQERKFRNFLASMKGKVTIILVSDKADYSDLADRICVVDGGRLQYAEDFSYKDGAFSRLPLRRGAEVLAAEADLVPTLSGPAAMRQHLPNVLKQVFKTQNQVSGCFPALLEAVDFNGSVRDVFEALPYFEDELSVDDLNNSMARLGFRIEERRARIDRLDPRLLPCLFVPPDRPALVVENRDGIRSAHDGTKDCDIADLPQSARLGTIYRYHSKSTADAEVQDWVVSIFRRFSSLIPSLFFIGTLHAGLTLASPLFLILVYGSVIPSGSLIFLAELYIGVVLTVLIGFFALRQKASILAFISGRVDYLMSTSILSRVLAMPSAYTERASIGSQYARLRGFEGLRDVFHSPIGSLFVDLPSTLVVATALFVINPLAALVFAGAVTLYVVTYKFMLPRVSDAVSLAASASAARNEFLIETIFKLRSIREIGGASIWLERMRGISAHAVDASSRAASLAAVNYSIGHLIMTTAGLAIVAISIPSVWAGTASPVVLIVSMTLMWRVLNPAQMVFSNLTRVEGLNAAKRQINSLMQVRPERPMAFNYASRFALKGGVEFSKVSFRYSPQADPSLLSVDFKLEPGQILAVGGANGAGKSTLMSLILGMYRPQAGSIMFDAIDSRQIDPFKIRRSIGYAPAQAQMFRATILQNVMFSRPDASMDQIWSALEMSGAAEGIRALSQGLDHRLGDGRNELPFSLVSQISLARAYLSEGPLLLLDEPTRGLSPENEQLFLKVLDTMRGKKTIIFSSHRISELRRADKVLLLDKGYVRAFAPPGEIFRDPAASMSNSA
jgi:ATP-binding cassette subfamily B protein